MHGSIVSGTKSKEEALMLDVLTSPIQAVVIPVVYTGVEVGEATDSIKKSVSKE